jgi:LPS export ABC transporter protein LptC
MHLIARVILVVVGLFVLAVGATLVARSRTHRTESVGPAPSRADLAIKDVEIEEDTRGVRWRLRAEQALIFDQEGRTNLRKIAVDVQDKERSWTIVGEEGDYFKEQQNVEVRRNVVVTSSDGVRLETSVLRWDGPSRRLWTDAPVVLSRDRSVITGTGLEVKMEDESTIVAGPVRARFEKVSGG